MCHAQGGERSGTGALPLRYKPDVRFVTGFRLLRGGNRGRRPLSNRGRRACTLSLAGLSLSPSLPWRSRAVRRLRRATPTSSSPGGSRSSSTTSTTTSTPPVGVGPNSNIFTRRARIEARGEISENVVVYIQPSFEGGRNLSSVSTTCTSTPVPAGGGTPIITCRTTGRSGLRLRDAYDRRPVHQGGEQVRDLLPRGPGEAAFQPLRADLVHQPAVDRARSGPGTVSRSPPTTCSAAPASSPTTWARACGSSTSSTTCG